MSSATELQPGGSSSSTDDVNVVNPAMGTTYFGFVIKGAIIIGSYSHHKDESPTLMQIDQHTICTKVGHPVDQLFSAQCRLWKTQNNQSLPVQLAAELLEEMINFYSEQGSVLSTEALIAGWEGECPILYCVNTNDIGCASTERYAIGPGGSFIYDASSKYKFEMSIDEAVSFARWGMHLAADKFSKFSYVNRGPSVYCGGLHGWKKLLGDDVLRFPTTNIEDDETSKYWQEQLVGITELYFMVDAFSWTVVNNSKPHDI